MMAALLAVAAFIFVDNCARAGVDSNGSYETTIAIEVPEFHGIEPRVALTYHSGSGNGPVGVGWRLLASSAIVRASVRLGAPNFDGTDVFLMDGDELVPCATGSRSPSCTSGGTHSTRIESFRRIQYHSGTDTWTLWDRDGTKSEYKPQIARTAHPTLTYRWALESVTDTHGNVVQYAYWCDSSYECYLSRISYGSGVHCGNIPDIEIGREIPCGEIAFWWEPRRDIAAAANGDRLLEVRQRLKTIEVRMAGRRARAYRLEYTPSGGNGDSLLHQVRRFGQDAWLDQLGTVLGGTELPAVTVESPATAKVIGSWQGSMASDPGNLGGLTTTIPTGAAPASIFAKYSIAPPTTYASGILYGDLNGDASTDIARWELDASCSTLTIRSVFSNRFGPSPSVLIHTASWPATNPTCKRVEAYSDDLDGDGRVDLLFKSYDSVLNRPRILLLPAVSHGDGTYEIPAQQYDTGWIASVTRYTEPLCGTGDTDGDGAADFVCVYGKAPLAFVGTATFKGSPTSVERPLSADPDGSQMRLGDVDGDGRMDLMMVERHRSCDAASAAICNCQPGSGTGCPHLQITLGISEGSGFYVLESQETSWSFHPTYGNHEVHTGDINGDAKADLVILRHNPWWSDKDDLMTATSVNSNAGRYFLRSDSIPKFNGLLSLADYNGDGMDDLMLTHHHDAHPASGCLPEVQHAHPALERVPAIGEGRFALPGAWGGCGQSHDTDWQWSYMVQLIGYSTTWRNNPRPADVNGDGRADLLAAYEDPNTLPAHTVRVVDDVSPPSGLDMHLWRSADVTGDGREDLVYVEFTNPGYRIHTLIADGAGGYVRKAHPVMPVPSVLPGLDNPRTASWIIADVGGGLNGRADGRADLELVDRVGGTLRVYTLFSLGDGTYEAHVAPNPWSGAFAAADVQHFKPADIDGDARDDLVHIEHIASGVRVNLLRPDGLGGWVSRHDDYVFQYDSPDVHSWWTMDVNGDARVDLIHIAVLANPPPDGNLYGRALLSNGDGTFRRVESYYATSFLDTQRWRPIEANGDGMADMLYLDQAHGCLTPHLLLSRGDGRFRQDTSGKQCQSSGVQLADAGSFRMMDVNNDGRTDLVHASTKIIASWYALSTTIVTLVNEYPDWVLRVQQGAAGHLEEAWRWLPMDSDADGRSDLVFVHPDVFSLRLDAPSNRLSTEANGIGGSTNVAYRTSAGMHAYMPHGVLVDVVEGVTIADNVTAGGEIETTAYTYSGARWSDTRRRLLGFAQIDEHDGLTVSTTTYDQSETCGARPARIASKDGGGNTYAYSDQSYAPSSGSAPYDCQMSQRDDYECEVGHSCRHTRVEPTYDAYGNLVRLLEHGNVADAADDRLTLTPVYPNTQAYIVDRPAYANVYENVPSATGWRWELLSSMFLEYDDNLTATVPPDRLGELRRIKRWNNLTGGYLTTTLDYQKNGRLVRLTGPPTPAAPHGTWTEIRYDCTFHLFPVRQCNSKHCSTAEWNEVLGVVEAEIDPNGKITTFEHDAFARPTLTTLPDSSFLRISYPPKLQWGTPRQRILRELSDGSVDGVLWAERYLDGLGRSVRTVREGGDSRDVEYHMASSRPARISNAYSAGGKVQFWTEIEYDALKRPVRIVNPDGTSQETKYRVGAATKRDELGHGRTYYTDAFGRVVTVIEENMKCPVGVQECRPEVYQTHYKYNALGQLIGIVDNNGNRTDLIWDSLDRKQRSCDPDSGCWKYTYFDDDTLASQTDANGDRVEFDYDELGRVWHKRYLSAGGSLVREVERWYDADSAGVPHGPSIGRLVEITDQGPTAFLRQQAWYDGLGRTERESKCIDSICVEWATKYDPAGRVKWLTYPDPSGQLSPASERVDYEYGVDGRLVKIPGYVDQITYNPAGQLRRIQLANGIVTAYTYDPAREWLDRIAVKKGILRPLYTAGYGYDDAARLKRWTISAPQLVDTSFWYDGLDRVTDVTSSDPSRNQTFVYDGLGNLRLNSAIGVYDYNDPLHVHAVTSTAAGKSYGYDLRGNLVDSTDRRFAWNHDGMPTRIENVVSGVVTEHSYDADGQRVKKSGPQGTSHYYSPLLERDPNGSLVSFYYAGGLRIARRNASGVAFYHQDHLRTTRLMTDARGTVVNRYDYGPYGSKVLEIEAVTNEHGFAGERGDDETGLVYLNARYYDPDVGRFVSADTIVPDQLNPQALNRYAYAYNNPLSYVDPSGHTPQSLLDYRTDDIETSCGATACIGLPRTSEAVGISAVSGQYAPTPPPLPPSSPIDNLTIGQVQALGTISEITSFDDRVRAVVTGSVVQGQYHDTTAETMFIGFAKLAGLQTQMFSTAVASQAQYTLMNQATSRSLAHLTTSSSGAAINQSGQLTSKGGLFAGPLSNALVTGMRATFRTGLDPRTYTMTGGSALRIPSIAAAGNFSRGVPIGPWTAWQRAMGTVYGPAGSLNLSTGVLTSTGINQAQTLYYGLDAAFTTSIGAAIYSVTTPSDRTVETYLGSE
jgi:RHS repeat-associated protein